MSTITAKRLLNRPCEAVWSALADIGGVHRFHPLVASSPLQPGSPTAGIGAERTCHFTDGNTVKERVAELDEGKRLVIEIVAGTLPMNSARATFRLDARGNDETHVEMEMTYTPKFGVLGRAMDALVIKRKLGGVMAQVLEGLEAHLTTGAEIGADWTPSSAA